ncbi:MAG: ribonuclease HII [Calditrichaceae bacterium]|nr:ribonuclease HII [Calditrichaceae bacterium]
MNHHLAGFDHKFRQSGILYLCGIDEAGRGPLAGPVVAAALILKDGIDLPGIDDSKKLNEAVREKLEPMIKKSAVTFGIGSVDPHEIDRINILQATFEAMRRAVSALSIQPDYLIVDGRDFPKFFHKQSMRVIEGRAIIKGDQKSQSIAGASILAKVHRDRLMTDYDKAYPQYGFARHKGYATKEHRENILKYGPCSIHRKSFLSKIFNREDVLNLQTGF